MRDDNIKRKDLFRVPTPTLWTWNAQVYNKVYTIWSPDVPLYVGLNSILLFPLILHVDIVSHILIGSSFQKQLGRKVAHSCRFICYSLLLPTTAMVENCKSPKNTSQADFCEIGRDKRKGSETSKNPVKLVTDDSQYLLFIFDYSSKCHEPVDDSFALKGNW